MAARGGHREVVEALLAAGADKEVESEESLKAFQYVLGDPDLEALLKC